MEIKVNKNFRDRTLQNKVILTSKQMQKNNPFIKINIANSELFPVLLNKDSIVNFLEFASKELKNNFNPDNFYLRTHQNFLTFNYGEHKWPDVYNLSQFISYLEDNPSEQTFRNNLLQDTTKPLRFLN